MSSKKIVESLMGELLPFAKQMLTENGEFYPFGGWFTSEGQIVHLGAKSQSTDQPKSAELIKILQDEILQKARLGEVLASGLVFDVRVFVKRMGVDSDAIQLNLDHIDGYSAEVFLPYHMNEGVPVFGEMFAQEGIHLFGKM